MLYFHDELILYTKKEQNMTNLNKKKEVANNIYDI